MTAKEAERELIDLGFVCSWDDRPRNSRYYRLEGGHGLMFPSVKLDGVHEPIFPSERERRIAESALTVAKAIVARRAAAVMMGRIAT